MDSAISAQRQCFKQAAAKNDVQTLSYLLSASSTPSQLLAPPLGSFSAAHEASDRGCREALEFLLRSGAKPWLATLHGSQPLHLAAYRGHVNILELLVNTFHQDPNTPMLLPEGVVTEELTTDGSTPLILAARNGHLAAVRFLVEHCGASVHQQNFDGITALHRAAGWGNVEVLDYLISRGADINAQRTTDGATSLHLCAMYGKKYTCANLLQSGADIEARDYSGCSAARVACGRRNLDVLAILVGWGADVDQAVEACDVARPDQAVHHVPADMSVRGYACVFHDASAAIDEGESVFMNELVPALGQMRRSVEAWQVPLPLLRMVLEYAYPIRPSTWSRLIRSA